MIKILHCADLHLDSPMSSLDLRRAEVRRNELRAAFTSMTLSARMNKVDFLLISGDLFDSDYVSRETIALLIKEFAALTDCRIIISPGNHDPYTSASHYRRTEFPENVYIFDSPELSCFDFPDKNTTVYGWAFTSDSMPEAPIGGFTVEDPSRINLLCAHADLDTDSKYCPLPSAKLAECGFDYAALGHQHTHSGVKQVGAGYAAYSGCLEGRGFDETGIKGAILAAAYKDPDLKFAAKLTRFCKRHYEIETLDISGAASNADAAERISAMFTEHGWGDDCALRIRLIGNVSDECRISPAFLEEKFPHMFILEFSDETLPLADGEKLTNDPTLRGEFYRSMSELLDADDPESRELAVLALRYGLSALSGGDIIDF